MVIDDVMSDEVILNDDVKRPSVLLLDEVDVFFGEWFYGMSYRPCINIKHADGFKLIKRIWENRQVLPQTEKSVQQVMAYPEVQNLQIAFPNFTEDLLTRYVCVC